MCGIYGQIGYTASEEPEAVAATDILSHRGPDARGVWHDENVFLGMRRLSIIDLEGGLQPIWNEDNSCCVILNGEIYNHGDLRARLEGLGHCFRTRSDTEVIIHSYEAWGLDCVSKFNGMFAFAVWDRHKRRLFVARDRIGEKPLYYSEANGRLIFASELKAIISHRTTSTNLSPQGIANFLTFGHSLGSETIVNGIYKLPPGHYLLSQGGGTRVVQYWDIDNPSAVSWSVRSEDEYAKDILTLLNDSVRLRMVADVPVGAFLSGGVDSTAIVALMKRHATSQVKTFSLGFTIGGAYNELDDAKRVAEALGTEHHELRVEHANLVDTLRTLVYHYDEPYGDPASFPLYLLSRFAREHVKVVLCGDGGDELFGGYRRYAADRAATAFQHLPRIVTNSLLPALIEKMPRMRRIKRTLRALPIEDPALRYAAWLTVFSSELQAEILRPEFRQDGYDPIWPYPHYYHRLNGNTASDHLNRLMYVDLKTWLADTYMEKTDKAMMACSLEGRLPLLDHRLVELAFQIPGNLKIRGSSLKYIFKRAIRKLVPSEVLKKPKHGFAVPLDPWFRGELRTFTFDVLMDERTRRRGYFDTKVVERLWREHVEGREVWDSQLWLLLNFELWHRIYIDGEGI